MSDPSNYHRKYSPYGSYSLFQFDRSDVISVIKNSIIFPQPVLHKNSIIFPQPVLHTLSLYFGYASACTAHLSLYFGYASACTAHPQAVLHTLRLYCTYFMQCVTGVDTVIPVMNLLKLDIVWREICTFCHK